MEYVSLYRYSTSTVESSLLSLSVSLSRVRGILRVPYQSTVRVPVRTAPGGIVSMASECLNQKLKSFYLLSFMSTIQQQP